MKTKRIQEIKGIAERMGLIVAKIAQAKSGHYHVMIKATNGHMQKFYFAATPSDVRSDLNKSAELRRFANSNHKP